MSGISIPQLAAKFAVKAGAAPDAGAADGQGGSPFADILSGRMDSGSLAAESGDAAALLPMLLGERFKDALPVSDAASSPSAEAAATGVQPALADMLVALPALANAAQGSALGGAEPLSGQGQAGGLAAAMQALARDPRGDGELDRMARATAPAALAAAEGGTGNAADAGTLPAILAADQDELEAAMVAQALAEAKSAVATRLSAMPDPGAAAAAALQTSAAVAPAHAATTQGGSIGEFRIVAPLGGDPWRSAIGDSLVIMTGQQQNRAELVLTPPQLGRVEVTLTMTGDQANAIFVSANPAVREALESALPRLQELLADAGIVLNSQVGSELPRNATNGDSRDGANRRAPDEAGRTFAVAATAERGVRGLVDVFA